MLKIARIPDRTPVKLTMLISPELSDALAAYAIAYENAYGATASVADLAAAMLAAFIESDREFARGRQAPKGKGG